MLPTIFDRTGIGVNKQEQVYDNQFNGQEHDIGDMSRTQYDDLNNLQSCKKFNKESLNISELSYYETSQQFSENNISKDDNQSNNPNRDLRIINKKFDIPADALDYFYHCKYFSPNCNVYIKLTKETLWFPKDIQQAKLMAKSWATSLKERNKIFAKCAINIMFDFNVRAINFLIRN
jgi:hypothetical protein